jgi:3-methyladenine DNA glycosylase AlkD
MLNLLKKELLKLKNPKQAKLLSRFFKTGKGEYGEGDVFIGLKVPQQRKIAKKYKTTKLKNIEFLLKNKIHEFRLTALFILIDQYQKSDKKFKKEIFNFYLKNKKGINNWDLIDLSSPNIIGNYLIDKDKSVLYKLAKSNSLWDKRIAVLSTFAFIRNNKFEDSLKIAEILINDKHDLIHKAVGWMLREVGKKDLKIEEEFLRKHHKKMPRTMLRYAIEKFPKQKRILYLKK